MNWPLKKNKIQTLGEEIANAISHGLMIPFSIVIFFLFTNSNQFSGKRLSLLFFAITIFILYTISCIYHSLAFTRARRNFQKLDHICIYILIWGSFIPFLFLSPKLEQNLKIIGKIISIKWFFFMIQFMFIILGILSKIFWINRFHKMHLFFYLFLGWSGLFLINFLEYNTKTLFFLFLGGVFYSLGTLFFAQDVYKKYFHFIWHIFVLLGTIFHFFAIYFYATKL